MDQPTPPTNSAVPPPMPPAPPPPAMAQTVPLPRVTQNAPPGAQMPGAIGPDGQPLHEPPPDFANGPRQNFWQQPWVQNILPFATSLTLHAAIIIIGVMLAAVGRAYVAQKALEEQVIVPSSDLVENDVAGGVQNVGLGGDPTRPAAQDEYPEGGTGWAIKPGEQDAVAALMGGGSDDSSDPLIGLSAVGGGFGKGTGVGTGTGEGRGSGTGDGRGPLAPFGTPGGGGIGVKSRFMGLGGNARQIIYLCDATGTMINVFSALKVELERSISGLKSIQAFNIFFFSDEKYTTLDQRGLVLATPENKRKAFDFVEDSTASGTTNPIPAIRAAFAQKPQLIYVLTDGFDAVASYEEVVNEFRKLNPRKEVRVNTIMVQNHPEPEQALVDVLKTIATENGGNFKIVKPDEMAQ